MSSVTRCGASPEVDPLVFPETTKRTPQINTPKNVQYARRNIRLPFLRLRKEPSGHLQRVSSSLTCVGRAFGFLQQETSQGGPDVYA